MNPVQFFVSYDNMTHTLLRDITVILPIIVGEKATTYLISLEWNIRYHVVTLLGGEIRKLPLLTSPILVSSRTNVSPLISSSSLFTRSYITI